MRIPFEKKSYLIVDDFGDMRSMLRSMLGMLGVTRIDTANNGSDAVQLMERKRFDVILCDYNLGVGKDGQQVLEEARERGLLGLGAVFLMITAENTREMVLGAIEYEPDGYLSKPFTKDLLRNRLEKLLGRKEALEPVDQAVARRDYARAIALLDQRIAQRPKNLAELTRLKADLCLRSGAYDAAASVYERVLAIRELPWARLGLGRVHFARKQYREARELFQDLLHQNPDLTAAYDWLARAHQALGDPDGAQEVLASAVALSPKAILRQKALGELAMKNRDFTTAQNAFQNAVNLGKHSVYKRPALYARLAESQVVNEAHHDKSSALVVVKQMEREFARDPEAQVYAALSEASVHQALGNTELADKCRARSEQLYERLGSNSGGEMTLAMARTAARLGDRARAEALLQQAVRNNHEDDEFLREVEATYADSGLSEDPGELIQDIKREIIDLNNRGVKMAGAGRINEAIGLFEEAAEGMSGNRVINLNAAKVLIMHMERSGSDADALGKVRKYLERARKLDPSDLAVARVAERFHRIVSGTGPGG
jgi:CheY-like chemotaxis protein/Tfp pilus assembly protein PilF